jgi:DNA-binding MarR family transcriptional regulator
LNGLEDDRIKGGTIGLANGLDDRVFVSFILTSRAVTKYYDACLYRRMRFSIVKLGVLAALSFRGGAMSPSDIARVMCTERNNITTLTRRMSREGLVSVERREGDKRSISVVITDLGREVFERARTVPQEVRDQVLSLIDKGDLKALERPLETMRQNALLGIESLSRGPYGSPRPKLRSRRKQQAARQTDAASLISI